MKTTTFTTTGKAERADLGDGCVIWVRRNTQNTYDIIHQHTMPGGFIQTAKIGTHSTKRAAMNDAKAMIG